MSNRVIVSLYITLVIAVLGGCVGGSSSSTTASCPPIAGPITANVSDASDVSSVTIPDGAWGYLDAGGDWCATEDLEVTKIDVYAEIATYGCFYDRNDKTPPCSPYGALAAVDVKPSNVKFPNSPKPSLRYDLVVSPPECENLGYTCGYLAFYQLKEPVPPTGYAWRWVGPASETSYKGKSAAEGNINHFSTFALVELPGPRPIAPGLQVAMIVASDFLEDNQRDTLAAFEILRGELEETGQMRLFRFSRVDPAYSDPNLPEDCLSLATPAEQLTCLFPIGTEVILAVGVDGVDNLASITSAGQARDYEARLYADVQIH
jgi:hypothetical protein